MGYTHYLRRPEKLDQKTFNEFVEDVKKLKKALPKISKNAGGYHSEPIVIKGGLGEGEPEFTKERVWFNGNDEDDTSHETFGIEQTFSEDGFGQPDEEGRLFEFCKTARKPYDLLVCATLIAFKHHFGNQVEVSSDGDMKGEEWQHARQLYKETLGRLVPKQFRKK